MNQAIVDYLTQNKNQYSPEALSIELRKAGYLQMEINEAVQFVYATAASIPVPPTSAQSNLHYAGFWRRFVGWLIDFLILLILSSWTLDSVSSVIKTPVPDSISFGVIFASLLPVMIALIVVSFIIMALYYSFLESSALQATVGKYIAGLKITTTEGYRISFGKAFIRRVYSLLSVIPIFIGFVVVGFTAHKQTFHDILAKTVVIVNKPRKSIVLVSMVILTIIAGIFSYRFLGAGFYIKSSGVRYTTQSGNIDPELKATIIGAYLKRKALFASGDLPRIRQYLLDSAPVNSKEETRKRISAMSDSDFQKMVDSFNQFQKIMTQDLLRSPDTVWIFNETMDGVKIKAKIPPTSLGDIKITSVTIDMAYTNGQWY